MMETSRVEPFAASASSLLLSQPKWAVRTGLLVIVGLIALVALITGIALDDPFSASILTDIAAAVFVVIAVLVPLSIRALVSRVAIATLIQDDGVSSAWRIGRYPTNAKVFALLATRTEPTASRRWSRADFLTIELDQLVVWTRDRLVLRCLIHIPASSVAGVRVVEGRPRVVALQIDDKNDALNLAILPSLGATIPNTKEIDQGVTAIRAWYGSVSR
jgi:hypothetical protein